jgi:arylsulfatase A-like enzyme
MKAVMLMFDSLNRRMLPAYGCDWTVAPNFKRLEEKSVVFENSYVGSMPCMPARRELHTGRYNFLHRVWGPLEPFDDSMPQLLKENGVYTHLVTDHYHYFEDGGATYHSRYNSWEFIRGQEADPWKGVVKPPSIPENRIGRKNYMAERFFTNLPYMNTEEKHPSVLTFDAGMEFLETNHEADNWFLQIEEFDPHEPFFSTAKYENLYPHDYNGPDFDWPDYLKVSETPDQVDHVRKKYGALLSLCDAQLGRVLDFMDAKDMWKDTMLIVCTDHGFLLGEHGWWAKNIPPYFNEVAHTPLYIWDPRSKKKGERRKSLVQMIDFAPTLLEYFGVPVPKDVLGRSLTETIDRDTPVREAGLFGIFSGHVCCTDGRYVYMRAPANPENQPINNYTVVPMHMIKRFEIRELETAEMAGPFSFTKGCRVQKYTYFGRPKQIGTIDPYGQGTLLFDLETDPRQENPLNDRDIEKKMVRLLVRLMRENDAPADQYRRLGLDAEINEDKT